MPPRLLCRCSGQRRAAPQLDVVYRIVDGQTHMHIAEFEAPMTCAVIGRTSSMFSSSMPRGGVLDTRDRGGGALSWS